MATTTAMGIRRRTLVDYKPSSGIELTMVPDAFGFPDKEEVSSLLRAGVGDPKAGSNLADSSVSVSAFCAGPVGFGFTDRVVGLVRGDHVAAPRIATAGLGFWLLGPQDHRACSGLTDR